MAGIWILGIIVFVALVTICIVNFIKDGCGIEFGDVMAVLLCSALIAGIVILLTLIPSCVCKTTVSTEPQSVAPITALVDNEKTYSNRYLWRGYINENLYYCYIIEDEYGYKQEKIRADGNTRIKYISTNETPHLEIYKYEYSSKFAQFYYGHPSNYLYVFCVPEGSIIVNGQFEIDMN